jgi:hypothetical protein
MIEPRGRFTVCFSAMNNRGIGREEDEIVWHDKKREKMTLGACRNSICCVVFLFLARFSFQISFFSESILCTWPLFSHFVTNLDRLAGQPIQIFLQSRFRIQIFYVFPHGVNPVGDNCMMMKSSSRCGRWRNGGILGLCWIDDGHFPPLSLLSLSLFGILVAFVTIGSIVAVWCHR